MKLLKNIMYLMLSAQLCLPYGAMAHSVATRSTSTTSSPAASAAGAVNLNLASTHATMSAALLALTKTLTINVGGVSEAVTSASMLTPAEFAAASQVASGSAQTLSLGAGGNAIGGRLSLTSALTGELANLIIPQGVKLIDNFGSLGALQLSGTLVDAGKFIAVSSNPNVTNAVIDANNIYVATGGLLTSVNCSGTSLSLTLNALGSIANSGTISSAGDLNLNAGGTITNNSAATMTAAGNLNLASSTGNFVNAGLMAATAGNVNFTTGQMLADIVLNNTGGTVQALNGAINFRDPSFSGAANLTLNGGDYLSQALNLYSGTGNIELNVGNVTGAVSAYGGNFNVQTDSLNFDLAALNVTGDPIVIDTNTSGTLDISTITQISGAEFVAISAGEITDISSLGWSLNTSSSSGNGGNVILAAGANATENANTVSITGRSGSTIGNIFLDSLGTIDTGSTATNGSGGDITLIAYAQSAGSSNGGVILIGAPTLETGGSGTGSNGKVTIIGEYTSTNGDPFSINAANLTVNTTAGGGAGGGASGTGSVYIATATPLGSVASPIIVSGGTNQSGNGNGAIISGTFIGGAAANGAITLVGGSVTTNGANVTLVAGTNEEGAGNYAINVGAINTVSSSATGGDVVLMAGAAGSNVADINVSSITTGSSFSAAGGSVLITTPGNITTGLIYTAVNNGTTGGNVLMEAGGSITVSTTNGVDGAINTLASTNGGNVVLVSTGAGAAISVSNTGAESESAIDTSAHLNGGQAGAVTILTPGTISLTDTSGSLIYATGSAGTYKGGSILLSSGLTTGTAMTFTGVTNFETLGNTAGNNGLVWVLTAGGTISGSYTVNGVSNPNQFTSLTNTSIAPGNTVTLTFNSGHSPTGFSPEGFTSITDSGTHSDAITVNTEGLNLIVPLVSLGSFSLTNTGTTITSTVNSGTASDVALFGSNGITITGATLETSSTGTFPLVAAADTSQNGIDITANTTHTEAVNIGMVGTPAGFTYNPNGAATLTGLMAAYTISMTQHTGGGSNNGFTIAGDLQAFDQITLAASGSGSITESAGITLAVPSVVLTSATGAIGTNGTPLNLKASLLEASTNSGTNGVVIDNTGAVTIEPGSSNTSGTWSLTEIARAGTGSITIAANGANPTITAGTIDLTSASNNFGTGTISQNAASTTASLSGATIDLAANGTGTGDNDVTVTTTNGGGTVALTANSSGNVTISNVGNVTINSSSAGSTSTFQLTEIASGGNGAITLGNATSPTITAGTIDLTSTSTTGGGHAGSITQSASASTASLSAGTIDLTANGTGSGSQAITVTTTNGSNTLLLTASSTDGNVTISNIGSGGVTVSGASGAANNGTFTLSTTAASNGSIDVENSVTVTGTGTIALTAGGTGSITNLDNVQNGNLSANTVDLTANGGAIGSSVLDEQVITTTSNITATAADDVYLSNTGSVTVHTSSAGSSNTFQLVNSPSGGNGAISIASNGTHPTVTAGTIKLTVSDTVTGSGTITQVAAQGTASLSAGTIVLKALGTSSTPANNAITLTTTNGTSTLDLTAQSTNGPVTLINVGNVEVTGDFSYAATTFSLTTAPDTNHNGGIAIDSTDGWNVSGATVDLTVPNTVTTGSITDSGNGTATEASVFGNTINLQDKATASGNNIALTTSDNTTSPAVLTAVSTNGSVTITNVGDVQLSGASSASGTGTFSLSTYQDGNGNGGISLAQSATVTAGTIDLTVPSTVSGDGWIEDYNVGTGTTASLIGNTIDLQANGTSTTAANNFIGVTTTNDGTAPAVLTAASTNGSVTITNVGDVELSGASSASGTGTFSLSTYQDINGDGGISLAESATVTAGTIDLTVPGTVSGDGWIEDYNVGTGTTASLIGNTIDLQANGTSTTAANNFIGVTTTNDGTAPVALTAASTNGSVTITNVGDVQLNGASSASSTGTFSLSTYQDGNGDGGISLAESATVTAGTIDLTVPATVSGDGWIEDYNVGTGTTASLIGNTIDLQANGTSTTAANNFIGVTTTNDGTAPVALTAVSVNGSVTITNVGDVELSGASSASGTGTFSLSTYQDGNGNGGISLAESATVTAGTIDLTVPATVSGDGWIEDYNVGTGTTASLIGNTIDLQANGTSTTAENNFIGVTTTNDGTAPAVLTAASTNGSVTITNVGDVELSGASSASGTGTFSLSTYQDINGDGGISLAESATVTAGTIDLTVPGTVSGDGWIEDYNVGTGTTASLIGNTIDLQANGTSTTAANNFIGVTTTNDGTAPVALTAVSVNGSVTITNVGDVQLNGASSASGTGTFSLSTYQDGNGNGGISLAESATVTAGTIDLTVPATVSGDGWIEDYNVGTGTTASLIGNTIDLQANGTSTTAANNFIGVTTTNDGTAPAVLTAASTNGSVTITNVGDVELSGASSASGTGTFSLSTYQDINGDGGISLAESATVTAGTIDLTVPGTVSGDGWIEDYNVGTGTTASLIGNTIDLQANGTSTTAANNFIGVTTTNDGTAPVALTAVSVNGSVTITNVGDVQLNGASSASSTGTFSLSTYQDGNGDGGIALAESATVTAGTIDLTVPATVSGDGWIEDYNVGTGTTASLIGNTIDLQANGTSTTAANNFIGVTTTNDGTAPVALTAVSVNGSVTITNVGDVELSGASSASGTGTFSLSTYQDINGDGGISLAESATVTAGTIDLTVPATVSGDGWIDDYNVGTGTTASLIGNTIDLQANGTSTTAANNFIGVTTTNDGTASVALTAASTNGSVALTNVGNVSLEGANSASGTFSLTTYQDLDGNGGIYIDSTNGATVTAPTVNLTVLSTVTTGTITDSGNGTGAAASVFGNTINLTDNAATTGSAYIALTTTNDGTAPDLLTAASANDSVTVTNVGDVTLGSSSAATGFTLFGTTAITLNTLMVSNGSILVDSDTSNTGTGLLSVNNGSYLYAVNGSLTLQNSNTTAGQIAIGANAVISAGNTTPGSGQISIVIGSVPVSPVLGKAPANVTVSTSAGGQVYFGTKSISALAPTNYVYAAGQKVVFNTGTEAASAIQLGGNDTIGTSGIAQLTNLDLVNDYAPIVAGQMSGILGGKLIVSNGVVTGGTLIITPIDITPTLTALNIPANVVVTMSQFISGATTNVALTSGSSTTDVLINGTVQYVNKSPLSDSVLNITSTLGGTLFDLTNTGKLTTNGTLTLSAGGNMTIDGVISGPNLTIETTTASNGSISIGNTIGTSRATVSLIAGGTGSITNIAGTTTVIGSTVTLLTGGSGTIGIEGTPLRTTAVNLTANTAGGNVYVQNAGNVNLGTSSGASFNFANTSGSITTTGEVSGNTVTISTASNGAITLGANVVASGAISIAASGNGVISQTGGSIQTGSSITLSSGSGSIGSLTYNIYITGSPETIQATTTGAVFMQDSAAVTLDASSAGSAQQFMFVTDGDLTLGGNVAGGTITLQTAPGSGGSIILGANNVGTSTTASVTLNADGSGDITQSAGGTVTGKTVTLLTVGPGTIEQSGPAGLSVNAGTVVVTVGGSGGTAWINDIATSRVALSNSTVTNGTFTFDSAGALSTSGTVTAATLNLATTAGNSALTIGGTVGQAGGETTLTTFGSGAISGTGKILGGEVNFASTTGSIASTNTEASLELTANTGGTGTVSITNTGAVTLGDSTSGGNFTLKTAGAGAALTIDGTVTAGGSLSLTSAGTGTTAGTEDMTVSATSILTADNGNLLLNNANQTVGTIELLAGASVTAESPSKSLGNVTIAVGSANPARTNTITPANITRVVSNGGIIYYGTNGIVANAGGGTNTLTANGRIITFSTGTAGAAAITLGGGTTAITAEVGFTNDGAEANGDLIVDTGDDGADQPADRLVQALP